MYLFESKKNYEVSFTYKGKPQYYSSNVFRKVYTDAINWLYDNGYKFDERIRGRELINSDEVPTNYEGHGIHYIPNTNYAILVNFGIPQSTRYLKTMLERFGATDINISGSEKPSIKKFGEIDTDEQEFDDLEDLTPEEPNEIERPKIYSQNPFGGRPKSSALCILGKSGAGKSTTTESILREMGHVYEFIIPSSMEANSFIQYTGSGYDISNLGELILRAKNDPSRCYTALFDECHRSLSIKRIEEDLLQAISRARNLDGRRFFTLDRVSKQLYIKPTEEFPTPLETESGKIFIPDNFGFIFLSSNANNITRNPDFFNRVDITIFTEENRNISDLTELSKEPKIPQSIRDKFDSAKEHGEL